MALLIRKARCWGIRITIWRRCSADAFALIVIVELIMELIAIQGIQFKVYGV